jgi:hypothetical protein
MDKSRDQESPPPAPIQAEEPADQEDEADIAPVQAKQRKKEAKPRKPMPDALPGRELEGSGRGGLGAPVPMGTWDGYPQTQAFSDAVSSAVRAQEADLARALNKIRRALRRYKKVHPQQRVLAHKQEARILERLGRHAEATEAKKKAREIESAN